MAVCRDRPGADTRVDRGGTGPTACGSAGGLPIRSIGPFRPGLRAGNSRHESRFGGRRPAAPGSRYLPVPGLVCAMHRQLIRQAGNADDLPQ